MKRLHFDSVGRGKATFDVPMPPGATLEGLVEEYGFLARQVRPHMMSVPGFELADDGTKILIYDGVRCTGLAWIAEGGAE